MAPVVVPRPRCTGRGGPRPWPSRTARRRRDRSPGPRSGRWSSTGRGRGSPRRPPARRGVARARRWILAVALTRAGAGPKMRAGMPAPDWSLLLRTPAFETTALLMGLVVGSFANVCVHRLPRDTEPATGPFAAAIDVWRQVLSVVHPPSHCPGCGAADPALRQRARPELPRAAGALPLLRRPDRLAVPRGRGGDRRSLAGPRRPPRPERADARGDGPAERPAGAEPDRPRAPAPARRDHPPRHRAGPRGELAAGSPVGPLESFLAAAGAARVRRGRLSLEEAAGHRRPGPGRLEDGGDARGVPRVAAAAAERPPRLGVGGPRRRRRDDHAPRRLAVEAAPRDVPGSRGDRDGPRGDALLVRYRELSVSLAGALLGLLGG